MNKLTPPTKFIFRICNIAALAAFAAFFFGIDLPVSPFYVMTGAYVLLALACILKNL